MVCLLSNPVYRQINGGTNLVCLAMTMTSVTVSVIDRKDLMSVKVIVNRSDL